MKILSFLFISTLILLSSCHNFPRDPKDTLEKVKNDTLVVGYSENPPWVIKTENEPIGEEAELVKSFAKTLNATISWKNDSEQNLFELLEKGKIHMVIAGITEETPWKDKVGLTRAYMENNKKKHVMAVINGENGFLVALEKFLHENKKNIQTEKGN